MTEPRRDSANDGRGGLQEFIRDFDRFMAEAVQPSRFLPEGRANELAAAYTELQERGGFDQVLAALNDPRLDEKRRTFGTTGANLRLKLTSWYQAREVLGQSFGFNRIAYAKAGVGADQDLSNSAADQRRAMWSWAACWTASSYRSSGQSQLSPDSGTQTRQPTAAGCPALRIGRRRNFTINSAMTKPAVARLSPIQWVREHHDDRVNTSLIGAGASTVSGRRL